MMSDNSIVIFLLDCSYGAMLPRVLSWLYSEQTAVSVWLELFLWRPLHTWQRFHMLSYCAILQPMKFLWGCSRMAAHASFKKIFEVLQSERAVCSEYFVSPVQDSEYFAMAWVHLWAARAGIRFGVMYVRYSSHCVFRCCFCGSSCWCFCMFF